jgi:hypothetical protein
MGMKSKIIPPIDTIIPDEPIQIEPTAFPYGISG